MLMRKNKDFIQELANDDDDEIEAEAEDHTEFCDATSGYGVIIRFILNFHNAC